MLGLAAMSCTINADPNSINVDVALDQSDDTTDGSGVRSSDATDGSNETSNDATAGGSAGGSGTQNTAGTGSDSGSSTGVTSSESTSDTSDMTATETTQGNTDTTTECAKVDATFTAVIPSIYLLVDRSGSMKWSVDGTDTSPPAGQSRWSIVEKTLMEEGNATDVDSGGVVYRMQGKAKFALATYTGSQDSCPVMASSESSAADQFPKLNNWSRLRDSYAGQNPGGATPSSEAIDWVWKKFKESDDPNRILVFASDGAPSYPGAANACPGYEFTSGITSTDRNDRVVEVVEAMYQDNIKTFVISVGGSTSASAMDAIARAGVGVIPGMTQGSPGYPDNPNSGESQSANYFFAGTSSALIESAFESVITGARPCKFELDGTLNALGSSGEVLIDGVEQVMDDPDGWRINSVTEIELLGEACKQVRSKPDVDLKVSFSCEVFQPG